MIGDRSRSDTIETQAAAWFARQRRGEMSTADEAAFAGWLSADPQHAAAYDDVAYGWQRVELVRADPRIIALREAALQRRSVPYRTLGWVGTAIAASVALFFTVGPTVFPESHIYDRAVALIAAPSPDASVGERYVAALGEKREVKLPDGSVVTLDTNSSVRVAYQESTRLVMLESGQAFFEVAKDRRRPFIVFAGNKRVLAVGTAFDVRVEGDEVSVTLREGKVRVEAPAHDADDPKANVQAAELVPGTRLTASNRNGWHLARADLGRNLSWLHGQLVFDGESLGTAVAEMNRYSATKIVIADAKLARTPISGVFAAGQPEVLAEALAAYKLVRIAGRTATAITLVAPSEK